MQSPTRLERSQSRGRGFESSGRGGLGNIRASSASRDGRPVDGPDDFSVTRGREPLPASVTGVYTSSGRGGVGNIHSPSRTHEGSAAGYDAERIRTIDEANETGVHSTGRGGVGNIVRSDSRSQSRSRSRGPARHSIGRGGAGNIKAGEPSEMTIHEVEDAERQAHYHEPGMHSTGRGGLGNIAPDGGPRVEAVGAAGHPTENQEYTSSGRGGAGNIRQRSGSREPSKVSAFLHRLGHGKDGEVEAK